jgi:hypothetical protein
MSRRIALVSAVAFIVGATFLPSSAFGSAVALTGSPYDGTSGWSVAIERTGGKDGEGEKGRLRPCLSASSAYPGTGAITESDPSFYEGNTWTLCVGYPSLASDQEPLIVEGGEPTRRRGIESGFTVVGIAFAPTVASVVLTNYDGTRMRLATEQLTAAQAKQARLRRLRWIAFALEGPYCVDRLRTFGASGEQLWNSGKRGRCPAQEFPSG